MAYTISHTHTLDGVKVEVGMVVWDYDLRRARVGQPHRPEANGDVWYDMENPETGARMSIMNPSRMWVRHPSTGVKA
jgi:hypothetical protein